MNSEVFTADTTDIVHSSLNRTPAIA